MFSYMSLSSSTNKSTRVSAYHSPSPVNSRLSCFSRLSYQPSLKIQQGVGMSSWTSQSLRKETGRFRRKSLFEVKAQYSKQESSNERKYQSGIVKKASTGSILGALALITGSTVGAGMLALPQATAAGGFIPSVGVMFLSWLILTSEALLMAEVNCSIKEKQHSVKQDAPNSVISLRDMAEQTLGSTGGTLVSGLYLFLANTLLVAYISKGGELLGLLSDKNLPTSVTSVMFTLGLGGLLWKGSDETVDLTNRVLTGALLFLFGVLLLVGSQSADFNTLLSSQNWSEEWSALPVVFLALVYHDLVPVLCKYLNWNKSKIRTALVCGSFIPFSLFVAWDAVALALVPGTVNVIEAGGVLDPVRVLIETQGDLAGNAIGIFSLLAISTSFIGATLGLSEYFKKEISKWFPQTKKNENTELDEKLLAMCFALGPPSLAAFSSPGLFFAATRIAGGYGMTLLYGVLPPIMAWYNRQPLESNPVDKKQTFVPGGRPLLASLTSFAASIELGKLFSDLKGLLVATGGTGVLAYAMRPLSVAVNVIMNDLASVESPTDLIKHLHI
eukprot:g2397.t1